MKAWANAFFGKVCALRLRELWLLVSITGMLVALPVLQRSLTLPALVKLFGVRTLPPVFPPLKPDRLLFLIRGLLQQHIGVFRPNCVKQSLVLFHFLHHWGYPVNLYFGVAKHGGTLAGHCWLTLDGQPLAEPVDPHQVFTVVYAYPEPS